MSKILARRKHLSCSIKTIMIYSFNEKRLEKAHQLWFMGGNEPEFLVGKQGHCHKRSDLDYAWRLASPHTDISMVRHHIICSD